MITNREYLEDLVNFLNNNTNKKYEIVCFKKRIPNEIYDVFSRSWILDKEIERNIIGIKNKNYNIDEICSEYLISPEKHNEFFEKRDFILCFGPHEDIINYESILNKEAKIRNFYGFDGKIFQSFISINDYEKRFKKRIKYLTTYR